MENLVLELAASNGVQNWLDDSHYYDRENSEFYLRKTEFNSKVYFLTKEMRDKFEVEHTVSIIYIDKEKKRIAVKEVSADEKDNN